jgi:hypothetical protein
MTQAEQDVVIPNGITPNGITPNGITPNGITPNETTLNGITPNGITPNGTAIGITINGAPLTGANLVGTTWPGHVSDGTTITLRIDEARQGTGSNADVWSYRITSLLPGGSRPLCVDAAGHPIFADSVSGTWNLHQGVPGGGSYDPNDSLFTVACQGSVIAKCIELGYKTWTGHARELATCVRALRADYCGDGTPYTVNGTLLNIFDAAGIQRDTMAWVPEAEWTPDGATCVSKQKNTRFHQVLGPHPTCYPHSLKPEKSCGTAFSSGAAIITELPPQ